MTLACGRRDGLPAPVTLAAAGAQVTVHLCRFALSGRQVTERLCRFPLPARQVTKHL